MKSIATVIPNRNDAPTLRRALMSVCTGMRLPDEVLILDDCSTDESMDVIERYVKAYPFVSWLRYENKSPDWRAAACLNALTLTKADYIHSLSANDWIDEHFYLAVDSVKDAGFIFGEYSVFTPDGNKVGNAYSEMLPGHKAYPSGVLQEQLCRPKFFEGGPCAVVRRDAWKWLCDRQFWTLKTWQDSIGYSAAAYHFDASYLPFLCGNFTFDPESDGERNKRGESVPLYFETVKFLEGAGLPERLKEALKMKVFVTVPDDLKASVPAPKLVPPEQHWLKPEVMLKEYRRAWQTIEGMEPEWLRWPLLKMLYSYVPRHFRYAEMTSRVEESAGAEGYAPADGSGNPAVERTLPSDEARITASSCDLP